MKRLLILLLLVPLAFAAHQPWETVAMVAIATSLLLLGVLYMVAIAFSLNDLKFLSTEELYQLIATAFMIALLFSAEAALNEMFSSIAPDMQAASLSKIDASLQTHADVFNLIRGYMIELVPQSTKSMYCGISGAGFSVAPCGSFSALIPPLTLSLQALSLSIAELSSLRTLASFGDTYAFTLLLPIGILLRTFRFTRGAGALFIGLAVSLYLFLPLAVIFMDELTSTGAPSVASMSLPEPDCDVHDFSTEAGFSYGNADEAISNFDTMLGTVDGFLFIFLVRGTMQTIVSLLAFFAAFRWLSKLAGAEVDVSALMKIS
ncbi:MAG: hypothetical protein AB1529_04375 [Candidatus Micrarchaeota archaeon]